MATSTFIGGNGSGLPKLGWMPPSRFSRTVGLASRRLPGLKNLPVMRLLIMAEVVMLARDHFERLTPRERRRLVVLVREARGRPSHNLSSGERDELEALIAKADPKQFASEAARKLSPVRLPHRRRAGPAD